MRLRDILTGNTQHVIDEAALPPSAYALFNFLDQQGSTQLSTARRWNPRGVGRPRYNAFNGQVTELLRDPFVVANMLAALNMASDRGPVAEGPAMKLMQEQVRRAEAKTAALEKEKAALAEELRDAEATAAAKADGISSVTLDAALKAIRDALDRAKHQSEQASRNIDLIVGVDGSDLSMAELGVLSKVGDLVHLSAEVLDAAVASAPGLAQQLDELVATPRAKPELALIKRRRAFLKLLEVAKVRRTKGGEENVLPRHAAFAAMATGATAASVETRRRCMGDTISFAETWRFDGRRAPRQQRLEHFNSFETNPLLQSWFAIAWPLQTLPLEKTLRELGVQIKSSTRLQCELGVRSKPFVEVRAADFDIDAHSQPWLAKELGVLSVDGGYGRDLLKRTTSSHDGRRIIAAPGQARRADGGAARRFEAAETAAATPLAGPTGDAAAASTTVSAQPAAATPSTAVPATSTAATVAATSTAVEDGPSPRESLDAFLAINPSSKQVQEACMAWGFGRNEDVTQYKRAAKLDHGTGMTICRLARPNGINLLKYLVEHIDEPCFQGRNLSPLVVPPDIAATAESLEPARKSGRRRRTAAAPSFGLEPSVDPQAAQSGRLPRACTLRDASARGATAATLWTASKRRRRRRRRGVLVCGRSASPSRASSASAAAKGARELRRPAVAGRPRLRRVRGDAAAGAAAAASTLLSMRVIRKFIEDDVPLSFLLQNPKGGKSRDRYEAYKVATSAAEFQERGGSAEDLRNDLRGREAELAPRDGGVRRAFQSCLHAIKAQGLQPGTSSAPDDWDPLRGLEDVLGDATCGLPLRASYRAEAAAIRAAATPAQRRAFAGRWLDIVDDRAKVLVERSGPRACGALASFRAHVLEGLGNANLDAAGRADVDAYARLIQSHIDENQAKARRLDDLATRIAAARLAADDGGGAATRTAAAAAAAAASARTAGDGDGGFDAYPSSFGSTICRGSGTSWRPAESR
ncbi:hypothetical protein JL721_9565 [Aureococcus anophagefferens]|nr:hypothetical protein JL721_9565 [Aureococcus anophagefferens]